MDRTISATDLARRLGDVLGRIRYLGESFVIERNGAPVARIGPIAGAAPAGLGEALLAWRTAAHPDPGYADDLEHIEAADRPPHDPWAS